ncbi:hypothetical protein GOODEAATRI_012755, partial [Goodea atripinnis]
TFQEEELIKARTKPNPRSDMYQKMVKADPSAPTAEEHAHKGVNKWRYLQWRDKTSSTSTLGFRIEGIMNAYHSRLLDLKDALRGSEFFRTHEVGKLGERCVVYPKQNTARSCLLQSHNSSMNLLFPAQVIGSSLLFVHDHNKASVWMIDFGKTTPLPDSRELQHVVPWVEGNREDGYMIGLTSILTALSQAISVAEGQQEGS